MRPPHANWHDVVFLLKELCTDPTGPDVERAWRAIKIATEDLTDKLAQPDGHLWKRVEKLMAKAEAERLKSLTAQQDNAASDLAFIPDVPPFPSQEEDRCTLDIGADRSNLLQSHLPQNSPEGILGNGPTSFLSTADIPAADDTMFIGGQPHSERPGYSGAVLSFHAANSTSCPTMPGFNDRLTDPFRSRGAVNHVTDNSLDWVMLDDMAQQAVPQMGRPAHRDSDEFPNGVSEWVDWV